MAELKKYILKARKGFLNEALRGFAGERAIRIIHSIASDGPKLVELDEHAAGEINRHPELRASPIVEYSKPFPIKRLSGKPGKISSASYPISVPRPIPQGGRSRGAEVTISVKEKKKGKWVSVDSGLLLTAFSDVSKRRGDEKATDNQGKAILRLSGNTIERLYFRQMWGWGAFRKNEPVQSLIDLRLEPLNAEFKDCVRRYYDQTRFDPSTGVTVGVIDTGVGPHRDLNIVGGRNTVTGEPDDDYVDVDFHGTFVAGLIGSRGDLFPNLRGLSPDVRIRAYRVFGGLARGAGNYDIADAIHKAQADQCDILNLSLEDGVYDDFLQETITHARDNGTIIVVAAGNDGRKAVNYPAAYRDAIAVSAMGCEGTFPEGALEEATVSRPPYGAREPREFIAAFSNVGDQISVTGLGVGVLSTLPKNQFGSCSGTSMAAPVISGAAASLLSQNPSIYKLPRNRARSVAIEKLLFKNCTIRGFGRRFEGYGMPDPRKV